VDSPCAARAKADQNEEKHKKQQGICSRMRQSVANPRSIDAIMLKLYPLAFILFNIVFWTYYLVVDTEN
jgi:hypothetical protein